ncbi:hypothetical protein Dimus_009764 [Dionaea muscipula]
MTTTNSPTPADLVPDGHLTQRCRLRRPSSHPTPTTAVHHLTQRRRRPASLPTPTTVHLLPFRSIRVSSIFHQTQTTPSKKGHKKVCSNDSTPFFNGVNPLMKVQVLLGYLLKLDIWSGVAIAVAMVFNVLSMPFLFGFVYKMGQSCSYCSLYFSFG